jgi:hypothetical protein
VFCLTDSICWVAIPCGVAIVAHRYKLRWAGSCYFIQSLA